MEWNTTWEDPLTSYVKQFDGLMGDQRTRQTFGEIVKGIIGVGSLICRPDCGAISGVEQRQERVPTCDPEGFGREYEALGGGCGASDQAVSPLIPSMREKPYTQKLERASTVLKSTPPALTGEKRLTKDYPAITATVVNMAVPAITSANWFSYTLDFVSQNWEIERALRMTLALFPNIPVRFVGDCGLGDQKVYRLVMRLHTHCIFRAQHASLWSRSTTSGLTVGSLSDSLTWLPVPGSPLLPGHLSPCPSRPSDHGAAGLAQDPHSFPARADVGTGGSSAR